MNMSGQSTQTTIDEILAHYAPHPPEMLSALEELSNQLGYLPCTAIESAAKHFRVPQFQVYGLATFYSMWHPVSKPVVEGVELCDDGPCHAAGAGAARRALEQAGVRVRRRRSHRGARVPRCSPGFRVMPGSRGGVEHW
jgi:NADH:ubiquinone oxidoreductase subunit E